MFIWAGVGRDEKQASVLLKQTERVVNFVKNLHLLIDRPARRCITNALAVDDALLRHSRLLRLSA